MKLKIVYEDDEISKKDIDEIEKILDRLNIRYILSDASSQEHEDTDNCNYIIVIGGDRLILKTLLQLSDRSIPIISLHGRRSKGFLPISSIENISQVIMEVIRGNYYIEEKIRLLAIANDSSLPPALNELAIFSKLSGKLIRYSLMINDEFIWRDDSDGVIISTPTGSTAYALSAGGPIIKDGNTIEIVPVNTLIPTHRPIITSSSNIIKVSDLCPSETVLIIDGQVRINIESSEILVKRAEYNARFLKLKLDIGNDIDKKLARRLSSQAVSTSLEDLPPSAKLVFKILEYEGALTTKEITNKTGLPARTVRYALNLLLDKRLIIKRYYNRDARISVYILNIQR